MAGNRTLKLSILADVDDLRKGLGQADNEVQGFGAKIEKFGKIAGAALLSVGVAAAAASVEMVKNAAADEAAQRTLAKTLENTTAATRDQIAAVEDWVTQTSLAKGVTDDELRPALARLSRSTKDVEESQKLLNLALDISAATGKPLEAIANSLGKAYDGNTNALGKLGLGIDQSILKTKDFNLVYENLRTSFRGFADQEANTFEGRLRRLQIAFDEGKETIGSYILTAITPFVEVIVEKVVPAISEFSDNIGKNLGPTFTTFFDIIKAIAIPVIQGLKSAFDTVSEAVTKNKDGLMDAKELFMDVFAFIKNYLAPVIGTVLKIALEAVGGVLAGLITGFSKLASFINDVVNRIKDLIKLVKENPLIKGIGTVIENIFGGGRANGGPVSAGTTYLVGERGPELFTPNSSGAIIPNGAGGSGTVINLTVNGAIDPEGAARTIVDVLNRATARGGSGAGAFSY